MIRQILDKTLCNKVYCSLVNISIGLLSSFKYKFILHIFLIYKLLKYSNTNDKIKKRNYVIDIIEFLIAYLIGIGLPLLFKSYSKLF